MDDSAGGLTDADGWGGTILGIRISTKQKTKEGAEKLPTKGKTARRGPQGLKPR
jgi:hypothetical protein